MIAEPVVETFTIYRNPRDFPGKYVVRKWLIVKGVEGPVPTEDKYVADTIEEVRLRIPSGFVRIERMMEDDPVIVESWV